MEIHLFLHGDLANGSFLKPRGSAGSARGSQAAGDGQGCDDRARPGCCGKAGQSKPVAARTRPRARQQGWECLSTPPPLGKPI